MPHQSALLISGATNSDEYVVRLANGTQDGLIVYDSRRIPIDNGRRVHPSAIAFGSCKENSKVSVFWARRNSVFVSESYHSRYSRPQRILELPAPENAADVFVSDLALAD